jgi:pimeloyl-ACP methyl ester carboxylesterase
MCIGGAFIMRLLEEAPERVTAAVALQPIGLDSNRDTFLGLFELGVARSPANTPRPAMPTGTLSGPRSSEPIASCGASTTSSSRQ